MEELDKGKVFLGFKYDANIDFEAEENVVLGVVGTDGTRTASIPDGYEPAEDDYISLLAQTKEAENGIYIVNAIHPAVAPSIDYTANEDVSGTFTATGGTGMDMYYIEEMSLEVGNVLELTAQDVPAQNGIYKIVEIVDPTRFSIGVQQQDVNGAVSIAEQVWVDYGVTPVVGSLVELFNQGDTGLDGIWTVDALVAFVNNYTIQNEVGMNPDLMNVFPLVFINNGTPGFPWTFKVGDVIELQLQTVATTNGIYIVRQDNGDGTATLAKASLPFGSALCSRSNIVIGFNADIIVEATEHLTVELLDPYNTDDLFNATGELNLLEYIHGTDVFEILPDTDPKVIALKEKMVTGLRNGNYPAPEAVLSGVIYGSNNHSGELDPKDYVKVVVPA
jgi:hypothetical protein